MQIRFALILRCLAAILPVLVMYGCGTDAVIKWKTLPKDGSTLGKYSEIVIDVREKDGVRLGLQTRDRLSRLIDDSVRAVTAGRLHTIEPEKAGKLSLRSDVFITRYDDGRSFAASFFKNSGRMHMNGEVVLSDWQTGETLAEFEIVHAVDTYDSIGTIIRLEEMEPEFVQTVVGGIVQQAQ